jgi:transposase
VDYLGLPVAVAVTGARTHDVRAARELLAPLVPTAARLVTVMGDRGFRGLAGPLRREHDLKVVITERPDRQRGEFTPIQSLWRVGAAFAALGRWRRLARSLEGTTASATAWTQIAAVGVLLAGL